MYNTPALHQEFRGGGRRAAPGRRQRRPVRVPTTTVLDRSCHGTMFHILPRTMGPITGLCESPQTPTFGHFQILVRAVLPT